MHNTRIPTTTFQSVVCMCVYNYQTNESWTRHVTLMKERHAGHVCCGVLQCVLQCVAVCCGVLQCVAVCCIVRCSVLQCVAVCCSVQHIDIPDTTLFITSYSENESKFSVPYGCRCYLHCVCVCVCVYRERERGSAHARETARAREKEHTR